MKQIQLSERLKKVASYLPESALFADIGSDHAYLPCHVCIHDSSSRAIAGEVNEGPFQAAVNQVTEQGLQERIEVRKGDGLNVIEQGEVEQVTIAGMGGKLIRHILEDGKDKLTKTERIITQPNIDARVLREWFIQHNYVLIHEDILEEDGHIYEILVADKGDSLAPYTDEREKELFFGPFLLKKKDPAFIKKWKHERDKLVKITEQMRQATQPDEDKIKQFQNQIKWIEEVLNHE
ncbi:tRNA (adenine(22)-N(1))-methyltransferase TrmK [Pontibacillus sp. HMF3514]|uniref:tRNA (adenine(22)-N(1))-methyltransferase n=1 Tax=Pontibacillus sp. HMF3514 TaxID=2692425 RepID=UPI0013201FB2|nr:tRNA (adenine(22)-N(1))-methyltransferase TrmK [Pontibacillus sp. HMF3514]QHE52990.1 tRNA (adenine(22)-N(1))-methyltransferase TrmK [Pontibacillus sp. HMF3514]